MLIGPAAMLFTVLMISAVHTALALLPGTRPVIRITQPTERSIMVRANDDADLHCQLVNFPPGSTIKWYFSPSNSSRDKHEIATSTVSHNEQKYDIEAIDTTPSTWILQVRLMQPEDSGFYQCAAKFNLTASALRHINQAAFTDTVELLVTEPVKVVAQQYTVLTYLGETANISWTITGRPLPKLADIHITRVRGLVDKQTLLYDDRHLVTWNVTDSRTIHVRLTILQMTVLDAGTYMLFAGRGPLGSSAAHASVSLESLEQPGQTYSPEITSGTTSLLSPSTNGTSRSRPRTTSRRPSSDTPTESSSEPEETDPSLMTEQQMIYVIAGILAGLTALAIFIGLMCLWHRRSQKKHEEATYMRHIHNSSRRPVGPLGHINKGYEDMHSYSNYSVPFEGNYSYATLEADKYHFPRSRLRFIDELGSGKFGQILMAEALNILGNSKWTTVAVKMAKDSATDFEKKMSVMSWTS
ncbi:uncharacterized protein LOC135462059 [Liolophura sinensis]|uniref:uncharacterized protein LOC135462059 n=1 Tax=Liolophura sinensis TaxID=3198878 RepID=UPI003158EFF8